MATVGKVSVDLEAKIAQFESDMGRAARIAERDTARAARAAESRGREMQASFKRTGVVIGTAITAGIGIAVAAMGRYIQNTIEAEKVQAQLAARIKDTGMAAQRTLQQLNDQADRLQALTVFDDEAIGEAQAMLLTFKQISGVNFDKTIEAALDLATVMGTDAASAAKLLGKALNDPERGLTALTRAGITFTDAERERIKKMTEAGRVAEAQAEILRKLEGSMGTAAEAARNTLGGALQGLKNSFDNLLEGDSGSAGVMGATRAVNDFAATLNSPSVKQGVDSMVSGIARIAAEAVNGISGLARFSQNINDIFSISDKVSKGMGPEAFSDRQLQIRMANVQEQISKARKAGDNEELKRLLAERVKLVRENTYRIRIELGNQGKITRTPGTGRWANVRGTDWVPTETQLSDAGGTKRKTKGRKRDLPDFAKDAADELAKLVEQEAKAREEFEAMSASLAGPLAEANYRFIQDQERLNELARTGTVDATSLAKAQADLKAQYDRNVKAIDAQLHPAKQVIAGLEEELRLTGLSNIERQKAIALRYANVDAMSAEGQRIVKLVEDQDRATKSTAFWDNAQRELADSLFRLGKNAGDAKSIVEDFFDSIGDYILRMIAEDWAEQITKLLRPKADSGGASAAASGGGGGSWWSTALSWLGAAYGGGRASGGPVKANRMYEVAERGPETLSMGGRTFLLTGKQSGMVTPNGGNPGAYMGQMHQTNNIVVQGRMDNRTASQIATEVGRESRRAMLRNG